MTKLTTGDFLSTASIFLFLGALLLAPTTALAQPVVCPCDFFAVQEKEFSKYGIKSTLYCPDDSVSLQTDLLSASNGTGVLIIEFLASEVTNFVEHPMDACDITITKGRFKTSGEHLHIELSDAEVDQCRADVLEYADNLPADTLCP